MDIPGEMKDKEEYFNHKLFLVMKAILEMGSELSRSKIFEYISENLTNIFEANGSAIYLYDPEPDELTLFTVHNLRLNLVGTKINANVGLLGKVVRNRKAMKIDDYRIWPERIRIFEEDQYRALLEAPIIWRDKLLGVIGLVRTGDARPFSDFDLYLLSILAIQVGAFLWDIALKG